MRSLSFLLVTYYAVLRLFVTQIVPDVYPPPPSILPFRPFAVLGRLKIAWLAKTRGRKEEQRRNERRARAAFNQGRRH